MNEDELLALANRYQRIADRAYEDYQNSGIGRYATKWRANERLASALRIAATAAEDHVKLGFSKMTLARLAVKASRIQYSDPETAEKLKDEIVSYLVEYGKKNKVEMYEEV